MIKTKGEEMGGACGMNGRDDSVKRDGKTPLRRPSCKREEDSPDSEYGPD
jgi:hypothetical protein